MKFKLPVIFFLIIFLGLSAPGARASDIIKFGSDATVEENQTVNNIITLNGQITVSGLVENNVIAIGGSVVLTGKSVVRGNVFCIGGIIARGSGSQVFGKITEINSAGITKSLRSFFRGDTDNWSAVLNILFLFFQVVIVIFAILLALVLPRQLTRIKQTIQANKLKSFFYGLLTSLMITPLLIVLVISIIGIYLIPAVCIAIAIIFLLGYIAVAAILGDYTLSKIWDSKNKSLVRQTILGLVLLMILGWIPYVGWLIKAVIVTIGWGGMLYFLFSHRKQRKA
jgi:hypothetical protein